MRHLTPLLLVAFLLPVGSTGSPPHRLTFEQRVEAQEAIERLYHDYRLGDTRPFHEAVPREVLERKVRTYLRKSALLERERGARLTGEQLLRELERIARDTRYPERLLEIYAVLDHDPVLILECLARPALVERLGGQLVTGDRAVAAEPDARFDPDDVRTVATGRETLPWPGAATDGLSESSGCPADDTWNPGTLGTPPAVLEEFTTVWTGSEMIVWGGVANAEIVAGGHRYDPVQDVWTALPKRGAPAPRRGHGAVWTGAEMIVWGGDGSFDRTRLEQSGGRYDPAADAWQPLTTTGAPPARLNHSAVWTGAEMIVWGGRAESGATLDDGARYDPGADAWSPLSQSGAPAARSRHTAVWTGNAMIVWGGTANLDFEPQTGLDSGARYDPVADAWSSTSMLGAPSIRHSHTAVWDGSRMIVWGGESTDALGVTTRTQAGSRYDPSTDQWSSTTSAGAPEARSRHTAVWTGSRMIVWGGRPAAGDTETGGRYDPADDSWSATSTAGAPDARSGHRSVWTGDRMIVWGHVPGGGRYDPNDDSWSPVFSGPEPRDGHTAVWTGNRMIVWGGSGFGGRLDTGFAYDPLLDSVTGISTVDAPAARFDHTAVWTGSEMIVWGGAGGFPPEIDTGGRYDPVTDTWTPTSLVNAPSARRWHTAVWSGNGMVVWGGEDSVSDALDTGARYDPQADAWTSMSTSGAPEARQRQTAVWSGSEMLVWGGEDALGDELDTGGRYDPQADAWTSMSTAGAPAARREHTAVWSGDEMIVWGGYLTGTGRLNDGARYDPLADQWTPVSLVDAPGHRTEHSAVWTGRDMVVWGGSAVGGATNTGGRYVPATDAWTSTSLTEAPQGRQTHVAVFSGRLMLVWGGDDDERLPFGDGGVYSAVGPDGDLDGPPDLCDNCPGLPNPGQDDADLDAVGDPCDNCPLSFNPAQLDTDGDQSGDPCDPCPLDAADDADADGACADVDNCPVVHNSAQVDSDGDGLGDPCDNCLAVANAGQVDRDGDGAGDACECQPDDPNDREPAEVRGVAFDDPGGSTTLSWDPAAGADAYSVRRGDVAELAGGTFGGCVAEGLADETFTDLDVPAAGQALFYLVQAQSHDCGLGPLGFDSAGALRTDGGPGACAGTAVLDAHASDESAVDGTVSGEFTATLTSDDVAESIEEELSGGNPANRFSFLEHRWTFDVAAGARVELHVEGFRSISADGDDFVFEYSTDGGTVWNPIALAGLPDADDDTDRVAPLPSTLVGSVLVRVIDTDRTPGNQALDTVAVDEIWIRSLP